MFWSYPHEHRTSDSLHIPSCSRGMRGCHNGRHMSNNWWLYFRISKWNLGRPRWASLDSESYIGTSFRGEGEEKEEKIIVLRNFFKNFSFFFSLTGVVGIIPRECTLVKRLTPKINLNPFKILFIWDSLYWVAKAKLELILQQGNLWTCDAIASVSHLVWSQLCTTMPSKYTLQGFQHYSLWESHSFYLTSPYACFALALFSLL